ncbi:unnamed protein product [Eruca vesicaria subsp. sativa]|uniref:Ribosomal protein S6 n=1 Tax=Eruca vesicaria subsp. sativa TaxID=29727 RepID=A0ABC8L160_ERUVS|nr:unnamed protein product [Eruca vesicaria subsp. sativa]
MSKLFFLKTRFNLSLIVSAEFLKEKKGKVWNFSDWGMRRLAYKIQKAENGHYILLNFEMEAKHLNEFKGICWMVMRE